MFGISNMSLFLLAALALLIFPLKMLLTEIVVKPVKAIQEELSAEDTPKVRKRKKGKRTKKANNHGKKHEAPKPAVQAHRNGEEDSDEPGVEDEVQESDTKPMADHFADKARHVAETASTTDSEANQAYTATHAGEMEEEEEPVQEKAKIPAPVKLLDSSVQTEEQDIATALSELLRRIMSSNLKPERVDDLRDTFKKTIASKFGPDKTEATLSAECSKLLSQVETMKANMNVAVAVVQRAKQMQDYFKSIEQRYIQNTERLQDRLHKLNMSKANLQQKLKEKSNEMIERLKELDTQNRQALQLAKTKTAAMSSASLSDLEYYKSECNRLKAEYTSAGDLMRAQELEIQQLRLLASANKARIDELMNENKSLKERQMTVTEVQLPSQPKISDPDELPPDEQTDVDKSETCEQSCEIEKGSENVCAAAPEQTECGLVLE